MTLRTSASAHTGTVEAMLDTMARDGVVALFPSARCALEDWRAARAVEGDTPSHRTLVLRDNLAIYFCLREPLAAGEYETLTF